MAVLSAGGCWLPRGLTFGPTNGPEDFQELVFTVFSRRLYKDWFLFVDDLSVATGRKKCHADGPSGAHDVSCSVRGITEGELGQSGLNSTAVSFTSPYAHLAFWAMICIAVVLAGVDSFSQASFASPLSNSLDSGLARTDKDITAELLRGELHAREDDVVRIAACAAPTKDEL